jgi:mRNA-degrading endonuclease RelE of RelBE toxin-antitoxin system
VPDRYQLQVAGPAARAIAQRLPEAAAAAVVEFMTGPLLDAPRKVGGQLGGPLQGLYAARRGSYRILYSIDDDQRVVVVRDVDHRADVYRRR